MPSPSLFVQEPARVPEASVAKSILFQAKCYITLQKKKKYDAYGHGERIEFFKKMVLAIKPEGLSSILASWWKEVLFRPPHAGCGMHTHILILSSLLLLVIKK